MEADVPGLDTLEELIIEHKHLSDLLSKNINKIHTAISERRIKVKVEEIIDDNE